MTALQKQQILDRIAAHRALQENRDFSVSYQGDALYVRCQHLPTAKYLRQRLLSQSATLRASEIADQGSLNYPYLFTWE